LRTAWSAIRDVRTTAFGVAAESAAQRPRRYLLRDRRQPCRALDLSGEHGIGGDLGRPEPLAEQLDERGDAPPEPLAAVIRVARELLGPFAAANGFGRGVNVRHLRRPSRASPAPRTAATRRPPL
jgi:hypothetical protein